MVLPSIDTSAKGGKYHKPFYGRQIIKGKVNLLANRMVVMATIEGFLVLSSLRRGVNASEDHASSPSIGIITTLIYDLSSAQISLVSSCKLLNMNAIRAALEMLGRFSIFTFVLTLRIPDTLVHNVQSFQPNSEIKCFSVLFLHTWISKY